MGCAEFKAIFSQAGHPALHYKSIKKVWSRSLNNKKAEA
jgi:hypothetical protein